MDYRRAWQVSLSGQVTDDVLTTLRDQLGLVARGRLTDDWDEEFGYRRFTVGDTPAEIILWRRDSGASWVVELAFVDAEPPEHAVAPLLAQIDRAAAAAGLAVARREHFPRTTS